MRSIALIATMAMAMLFAASSVLAQTAPVPEQYRNTDEFGVDTVTGTFNFQLPELVGGGLDLVRYWGQAGWSSQWDGTLREETISGVRTISIRQGGISEEFRLVSGNWISQKADGGRLTRTAEGFAAAEYVYTRSDGLQTTYRSVGRNIEPVDNQNSTTVTIISDLCSAAGLVGTDYAVFCAVPTAYKSPNGLINTLEWREEHDCNNTFFPGEWTCDVFYRLESIRSSTGYLIDFRFATPAVGSEEWFRNTEYKLIDLSVQSCPDEYDCTTTGSGPTVTLSTPSAGVRQVVDSRGGTWRITVTSGRISAIQRPGDTSPSISISYASGRVTSITAAGATRTYSWGTSGGNTTVAATDSGAGGGTTTVVSDPAVGRPTSVTNATSNAVSTSYDSNGRVTRVTQPEGNYINYTLDARGNVTETRAVAKSGSGLADIVTTANFDTTCSNTLTCNQPNYVVDALGNRTDYTYSATHGGVTRIQMPAPVTSGTRPEINYTYTALQPQQLVNGTLQNVGDPVYKVTQVTSCASAATCSGTANETRVTIAYASPNLLPTSVTTASGNGAISLTAAYAYDTRDNLVSVDGPVAGSADTTTFIVDANDRRRGVIGPDPDGSGSRVRVAERYSFDAESRITKVERGTVNAATAAALDAMTALQTLDVVYDANGNRVRETASSGSTTYNVIQYGYDAQQRLACTALRMNPATWASLPTDACTAATAGSDGPDRITRNSYDGNDRVTLVETGVGSSIASTEVATAYTANGRIDHVRDGENNRTTYVYDGHDRVSQTRYPSTTQGANSSNSSDYEELTYDANSRVTSRRLRDTTSIGLGYDNLGRLISRNMPGSEPDATYGYDLAGRMLTAVQGGTTSFAYDALGRTISTTNAQGTVDYGYDAAGRRNRLDYTDSFYVTYDHDVLGNVTAIRENGAASGVGVLATYAYDGLGRRQSVTYGNTTSQTLTFDNADRLTTLANDLADSGHDLTVDFTYNPASQIGSTTRSADAYAWTQAVAVDRTYTNDGLNRIMTAGLTSFGYDARGNLTSSGSLSYSYNADNLMMTAPNGATLGWDALGRLNKLSPNATTAATRFAYDGIDMISEHISGAIVRRYVHGPGTDDPIVWYEGSGTSDRRFLHADERGSIVSVTNASGTVLAINSYDEYGIPASGNIGRFQYTGQQWLPEIGLYHYKARMYSPTLGRFMQIDPIGYADGMNWYAYVGDDPINYVDPLGLDKKKKPNLPEPDDDDDSPIVVIGGGGSGGGGCCGGGGSGGSGFVGSPSEPLVEESPTEDIIVIASVPEWMVNLAIPPGSRARRNLIINLRRLFGSEFTDNEIETVIREVIRQRSTTVPDLQQFSRIVPTSDGRVSLSNRQFRTISRFVRGLTDTPLNQRLIESYNEAVASGRVAVDN